MSGQANEEARARVTSWFEAGARDWRDIYASDSLDGVIYGERREAVMDWVDGLGLAHGAAALDVGCGAGLMAADLAERGLTTYGVDASPAMIELTKECAAARDLVVHASVGDVYGLPYPDDTFDLSIAVGVLPWLREPDRALSELARVVRPGGHAIISCDNRARLKGFIDPRGSFMLTSYRRARRAARGGVLSPGATPHVERWPSEFNRLLDEAGFERLERRTLGFGPFTWMGRPLMGDHAGVRLHRLLQRCADAGVPGLRATGWNDLALVRRADPR
jgi:SAM-dependent methyltransferase